MKFPDGLRICGASSVCCDGTFCTPSVTGLTSSPFFCDLRRRRSKLQLYLPVKRGKFGLQPFQLVLLLPHLARYLLQLRYLALQHLVLRLVLVDGGGYLLQRVQEVRAAATGSAIAKCPLL